ncbi:MAG: cobalamin B12-binding domain-containing protein [Candidatus Odinarchaeia archaeon]
MSSELLQEIYDAIFSFDDEAVYEAVKKALEKGVDPIKIIQEGITRALRDIGEKYEKGEFFLMHLMAASEATKRVIDELIQPALKEKAAKSEYTGKVVIGTVEGDIHDIGKNIVAIMLLVGGFQVYDLGKDVPATKFVEKAKEVDADIIALSALLSTTLLNQRKVIEILKKEGLRDKFKVIVGGAPASEEWAKEIGADGYAPDAIKAVKLAERLVKYPGES